MRYRIQEVSNQVEVPVSTIRYWQKEFSEFVRPGKTNGGQRRYSDEDIRFLLRIKDLLHINKKTIASAKIVLRSGNPDTGRIDWQRQKLLVTGGSGFWGKYFCKTMLEKYKPKVIRVFSRDERKHVRMCREFGDRHIRYFIGDVREADRLRRAMEGVDFVVHAAALKRTFSCEYNPFEAVKTNIHGAQNVIDAAIDTGVKKVIALSTVKAVSPLDLYGSTKLCAEKLFIQGNSYGRERKTRFACIRYANMIHRLSSLFYHRSNDDPELLPVNRCMTRFYIQPEHAVESIVKAFEQMHGGEIFVPRVPSIRTDDMIKVFDRRPEQSDAPLDAEEKLHEILITEEEGRSTIQLNGMYIILSDCSDEMMKRYQRGEKVAKGFSFTSDANEQWLSEADLNQTFLNN